MEDPWAAAARRRVVADPSRPATEPRDVEIALRAGRARRARRRGARPARAHRPGSTTVVGAYGWGRIDMVENRRVGIKSRETYECPGALALILAHADLESITPRARPRPGEGAARAPLRRARSTTGCGSRPLKQALDAFVDSSQQFVTGEVRLRLEPGRCIVTGRRSPTQPLRLRAGHLRRRRHASATRTPPASCACGASASRPGPARQGTRGRFAVSESRRRPSTRSGTAASRTGPAEELLAFTVSLPFDRRLAADDIAGSRAHVRGPGPGRAPRPTTRPARARPRSTRSRASWPAARSRSCRTDEDIHTAVERRVTELAGAGRRQAPHRPEPQRPGRHRPAALYASGSSTEVGRRASSSCRQVLLDRAAEAGRRLPARLHPPAAGPAGPAGPPPAGPRLGLGPRRRPAARRPSPARRVAPRRRRAGRLVAAARPAPVAAEDLGFAGAVRQLARRRERPRLRGRGAVRLALLGVHLSRIGEEVVLWSTEEFGFLQPRTTPTPPAARCCRRRRTPTSPSWPGARPAASSATSPACWPRSRACRSPTTATSRRTRSRCSTRVDQVEPGPGRHGRAAGHGDLRPGAHGGRGRRRRHSPPPTWPSELVAPGMPFRDAHAIVGALVRASRSSAGIPWPSWSTPSPASAPTPCRPRARRVRRSAAPRPVAAGPGRWPSSSTPPGPGSPTRSRGSTGG